MRNAKQRRGRGQQGWAATARLATTSRAIAASHWQAVELVLGAENVAVVLAVVHPRQRLSDEFAALRAGDRASRLQQAGPSKQGAVMRRAAHGPGDTDERTQ